MVNTGRLKIAAALALTSPFVPMLFQGEEWGASTPFQYFTDHPDHGLAKAVREGRRQESAAFGWKSDDIPDPQAPETFLRSRLNWDELSREPHAGLFEWHRQLIALRHHEPALLDDRLEAVQTRLDESARWLAVERGPITVVCLVSEHTQRVPVRAGEQVILLASDHSIQVESGSVMMPPDSVAILRTR